MIGIVGGGISGLFLLHLLTESGLEAILFESSENPGGVMQSRTVEGPNGPVTVDLGPQRMRLTAGLARLLGELDLTAALRQAPGGVPFTVYHEGILYPAPLSLSDAFRTRLISWSGKARGLADFFTPAPRPAESVATALTRKLGPEIYRRLAGPLLGGLYASDPERMEARHTLLRALRRTGTRRSLLLGLLRAAKWERTPVVSFETGMGALPVTLAGQHRSRIRLGEPVRTIARTQTGGYRLESDRGALDVDEVVLTLPAPQAAETLSSSAPVTARGLASLRYNPLAVVPLVVPTGTRPPETGSGFKMTLDDHSATRGVTAHETLFDRQGLFTAFLGGMGGEELVELPDPEIMDRARADFERVTGVAAIPLFVHRTAMPAWDRSWAVLDTLTPPKGIHLCAAFSDRPGIGGRLENAQRTHERLLG